MPTNLEPTNTDRRNRAEKALEFYKRKCLGEAGAMDETTFDDLIADLMHYAKSKSDDWDFEECLRIARNNFEAEVEDENSDREY